MITQERLSIIATVLIQTSTRVQEAAVDVQMAAEDNISATDVDLGNLYAARSAIQDAIEFLERA